MLSKVGFSNRISFGQALTTKEKAEFVATLQQAKEASGANGHSILIVHDACLPQRAANNTGVGNLSSEESDKFFSFMKDYMGFNATKVLPQGEYYGRENGFYCAYRASSFALGVHQINLDLLTKPEFGNILLKEEFDAVVDSNKAADKATMVNYENVLDENSSHNKALKKAFERFEASSEPKILDLKKQFEIYKKENHDWLEPKSVFNILKAEHKSFDIDTWKSELDKNLYHPDFDPAASKKRIEELLNKNPREAEFCKFKQFMADEHLKIAKANQNEKGLKLFGDFQIGSPRYEAWSNPKAFEKGAFIGEPKWKLLALDYSNITDETSPSAKFLKRKAELFAKRYDGIRFDVAWCYIKPKIYNENTKVTSHPWQGGRILDMIESTVKKVKGADFDSKNLIYEVEAGESDFSPFDWSLGPKKASKIEPLTNRMSVFSNAYMKDTDKNIWGFVKFFQENPKLSPDEFIMTVGNHDPIPLYRLAEIESERAIQSKPLAYSLKLDENMLKNNPIEFAKAKFAEVFTTKHSKSFYMNVFGRKELFDNHGHNSRDNYRYKITDNFESDYHKAIQDGRGLNIMDSMEKVFKAKGLDEKHPELYKKIVLFRDKLYAKGATTETEANELVAKEIKAVGRNRYFKGFALAAVSVAAVVGGVLAYKKKNAPAVQNEAKVN